MDKSNSMIKHNTIFLIFFVLLVSQLELTAQSIGGFDHEFSRDKICYVNPATNDTVQGYKVVTFKNGLLLTVEIKDLTETVVEGAFEVQGDYCNREWITDFAYISGTTDTLYNCREITFFWANDTIGNAPIGTADIIHVDRSDIDVSYAASGVAPHWNAEDDLSLLKDIGWYAGGSIGFYVSTIGCEITPTAAPSCDGWATPDLLNCWKTPDNQNWVTP